MEAKVISRSPRGDNVYDVVIASNVAPSRWYSQAGTIQGEFEGQKIDFFTKWFDFVTQTIYFYDSESQTWKS